MVALQSQSLLVLALTFGLALCLGILLHRSHFCIMGALSDLFLMGDAIRLRQWVLAIAVATLGFGLMSWLGWLSPLNTLYAVSPLRVVSLSLGGTLFGTGMVLSSGCVSKSLTRIGAGNLKSLVVLLVMGVAALATMRGWPAVVRVHYLEPLSLGLEHGPFLSQWLTHWTGWDLERASGLSALLVTLVLFAWVFRDARFRQVRSWWPGLGVGISVVVLWWISGVAGFVPEHPETLEPVYLTTASGRMEAISMTAPVAMWWDALMYFSDGSKRMTMGMALVPGLVVGAWISAHLQGSFRWEGFTQTPDLALHMLGGLLMGVGGVLAMGCTFGQGLSGLSTLSWGSMLAVSGIVLGAWLALQWQLRRAEAMA